MWDLKIDHLKEKNKLTDIENRLVVARGRDGHGGKLFLFSFFKFKYIEF